MAKLERYVGQLVEDRGGIDDSVMQNIVRDIEKSSRAKSAQKKVRDYSMWRSVRIELLAKLHSKTGACASCIASSASGMRRAVSSRFVIIQKCVEVFC